MLSYIPLPNAPGLSNNFLVSETVRFTRDIIGARIDQTISPKQNFFVRFSYERRRNEEPNYFNSPASSVTRNLDQFGNFTFNHMYSFAPTVINNARYGYTRARATLTPYSQGFDPATLGLPAYISAAAPNQQSPTFTIGGGGVGTTLPGEITGSTIGGSVNNQPRDTHMAADSVTIIHGAHTIRTGGEYRLYRFFPFQALNPTGSFS